MADTSMLPKSNEEGKNFLKVSIGSNEMGKKINKLGNKNKCPTINFSGLDECQIC